VTSPGYWADKPQQLAALLTGSTMSAISDPTGAPVDPNVVTVLTAPALWAHDFAALAEAMRIASGGVNAEVETPRTSSGAMAPSTDRLVFTVEEAAALLGIGRATAYEAVQRGEIPSMRIGRRILVPKAALQRMLDAARSSDGEAPTA
jgi:excisionase family DNA binding protein